MKRTLILSLAALATIGLTGAKQGDGYGPGIRPTKQRGDTPTVERGEYLRAIERTASMVGDATARSLAAKYGLDLLNLTWEDTGRYKGSSVGPNISDMTIQVASPAEGKRGMQVRCMPVIRFPNFSDKTCDLDPRDFTILVGNHKGRPLKRISLYDFLANPTQYMSRPSEWRAPKRNLLADRDSMVLVSAQACFLPVPKQGKATFNPVLFNYQSYSGDPAVLTILATREGTSMTIIDNKRDAFAEGSAWGQRLFHNQNGMRASLTGQRISEFKAQGGDKTTPIGSERTGDAGLNMVLLIQVPLKQKNEMRFQGGLGGGGFGAPAAAADRAKMKSERSDVEAAVIGHGELEGIFTETDNLQIQRDARYPIRVTVQFYKATSNGVVSEQDMKEIKEQIDQVYSMSDYVGSLVTEGRTGRVTEYEGAKVQPPDWWQKFWERHEANTGDSAAVARQKLIKLLGKDYMVKPVCELYLRDLLRKS